MNDVTNDQEKKRERNMILFLMVFLAPMASVAIVGSYGFIIWISQILLGPPGS
ncbi:periplasmic nitrate reductase, NapE protein [Thalassotalea agarivorans]|uniref:Nitrate reductase NapE n=1 Tax=Thalassotalea agarivorans TaxID=349064 RepID=A0A1H9ZCQ1_THASX|nr:periplasmic nitrate reductase, NapE protein [Thalassotalea agarivorans]SES79338.1 nitrate reductase NapE [Thalassotalea agarivorans]